MPRTVSMKCPIGDKMITDECVDCQIYTFNGTAKELHLAGEDEPNAGSYSQESASVDASPTHLSTMIVAGIIIGGVFGVMLLAGGGICLVRARRQGNTAKSYPHQDVPGFLSVIVGRYRAHSEPSGTTMVKLPFQINTLSFTSLPKLSSKAPA